MSNLNHAAKAADHLAAVEATRHSLAEELASPHAKAHTVNVLRDDLRNGLKAAEVHALLNIGHHLAALNGQVKRNADWSWVAPSPTPERRMSGRCDDCPVHP